MKAIMKKVLPTRFLCLIQSLMILHKLFVNYSLDCFKYYKHSRTLGTRDRSKLKASIVAHYHVLEKGLAIPDRRARFGERGAANLVNNLNLWTERGYSADIQVTAAYAVLHAYIDAIGFDAAQSIPGLLESVENTPSITVPFGGIYDVTKAEFLEGGKKDFSGLVKVRRSIRNYTGDVVSESLITQAVALAQYSPSVCNRQCAQVFWTNDQEKIRMILHLQNGNRGFGHLAGALLIVTSDLSVFEGVGERYQAYTDGGLFSMSLLYALTYLGLGACPLNWCVDYKRDRALRQLIKIPENQVVVMMISVGHLPDKFSVPMSQRNTIFDILWAIK